MTEFGNNRFAVVSDFCDKNNHGNAGPGIPARKLDRRAMTPNRAPTAQELLAFYLEAGVDCALQDEPVNRIAEAGAAVSPEPPQS